MENIFKNQLLTSAVIIAAGLALSGCGSSGGGTTVTSPNGIYTGAITGGDVSSTGAEEKAIIYNNRMLVLSNNANGVSQIFDASLSDSENSLAATGFRYGATGLQLNNVTYDGSYIEGQSAAVSFSEITTGTPTLPSGSIALTAQSNVYSKGSDISRLAGSWTGIFDSGFGLSMTLIIDASGNIANGSADLFTEGCVFTGSLSIINSAINAYTVNLISDGGSGQCILLAGAYPGLAWTEGDTNGTLVLMAADGNRGRAVVLTKN
ncbi:MAG: hypothetical protein OQK98_11320 [Gammaproteobacteria bacterium]|nr:hypothetical protein [Gammaproteobacteria bacterium]